MWKSLLAHRLYKNRRQQVLAPRPSFADLHGFSFSSLMLLNSFLSPSCIHVLPSSYSIEWWWTLKAPMCLFLGYIKAAVRPQASCASLVMKGSPVLSGGMGRAELPSLRIFWAHFIPQTISEVSIPLFQGECIHSIISTFKKNLHNLII